MTTYRHKDKAGTDHASAEAASLDELLALDGEAFIRCAYRTLLRRDADPGGLVNYLGFLDSGVSKAEIVSELRSSIEGRRYNVTLAGAAPLAADESTADERSSTVARDIDHLLGFDGQRFVESAYVTLFHRQADAQGIRHYVPMLRRMGGKAEVLRQLVSSEEYAQHQTPLRGMTSWLAVQPKPRMRILDRLSRLFGSTSGASIGSPAEANADKRAAIKQSTDNVDTPTAKAPEAYTAPLPANRAARALMTLTPYKNRIAQREHE